VHIRAYLQKEPLCQEVTIQDDVLQKDVGVLAEAQKIEVVVNNDRVDVDNQIEVVLMKSLEIVGIEGEFAEKHYAVVVVSYQTAVPQVYCDQRAVEILVEDEYVEECLVHWKKVELHYDIVKSCGFVEREWENEKVEIYKLMNEDQEYLPMIEANVENWKYLVLD
jgi:hypothetical protein